MDVLFWVGLAGSALFSWFFSRLYYRKALGTQSRAADEQIAKLRELADEHRAAEALELRLRLRKADVDYRRTMRAANAGWLPMKSRDCLRRPVSTFSA